MFTVETEFDHTKVVIIDDTGKHNDMTVRFSEDGVYMFQWYEDENRYLLYGLQIKWLQN